MPRLAIRPCPPPQAVRPAKATIEDLALNQACDLFLDDFRNGSHPQIEAFLNWVAEQDRPELFERLLRMELDVLRERQIAPTCDDYLQRFPQHRAAVLATFDDAHATRSADRKDDQESIVSVTLTVLSEESDGESQRFGDRTSLKIGRSSRSQVRLTDDPRVSRQHVRIDIGTHNVRVMDLESRNGTLLNGRRVRVARLCDGDVLTIGRTRLVVRIVRF